MKSPQDQEDISFIENPVKLEQEENESTEDMEQLDTAITEDGFEATYSRIVKEDTWHWYASTY